MSIQTKLIKIEVDASNICIFAEYATFNDETFEPAKLRQSYFPGQDISQADQQVQDIALVLWTPEVIQNYQDSEGVQHE
ncbi:MAG: hypothetical protein EKK54_11605 [Neisseriaceae bacterium]|nr:MAG: hypothetical protein EKK54_11605 [Neisseriaceae bacterium]